MKARIIAPPRSEQFQRAIGDYFVDVHIVRSARARLEDIEVELIAEVSGDDFIRRAYDCFSEVARERAGLKIGLGGGFLDFGEGPDQSLFRAQPADLKVVARARGLRAVKRVGGHANITQRIALNSELSFRNVCSPLKTDAAFFCPPFFCWTTAKKKN